MNIRKDIIDMTIQELKTEIKENVEDYVTTEGKRGFLRGKFANLMLTL